MHEGQLKRGCGSLTHSAVLWLEAGLAALIVVSFLPLLIQMLHAMAISSLNGDEIWSFNYARTRGLWVTWTDYYAANNHILFNLLTALTADDPLPAWRLRFWSFLAYLGGMALLVIFFARRQLFLESAVILVLFWGSQEHAQFMLEARGYALVGFFALGATLALVAYCEAPSRWSLLVLGLCCFAGTATLPTFVLFAAPLLLLLNAVERSRAVFLCGLVTGLAIALFYAPTVHQVLAEAGKLSEQSNYNFTDPGSPLQVIGRFLYDEQAPSWALFATWSVFLLAPLLLVEQAQRLAAAVVAGTVALFWIACLAMATALPRATAFILAPVVVMLVLGLLARPRLAAPWIRLALGVPLAALLIYINLSRAERFHLVPHEDFQTTAEIIMRLFPTGTSVHEAHRWPGKLWLYLPKTYPQAKSLDPIAFAAGTEILVDDNPWVPPDQRVQAADLPASAVQIRIPQYWHDFQAIWFVPPSNLAAAELSGLAAGEAASLTDGRPESTWQAYGPSTLTVTLNPARRLKALAFAASLHAAPRLTAATLLLKGGTQALGSWRLWQSGRVVAIDFRGLPPATGVEVTLRPRASKAAFALQHVWIVKE